MRMSERDLGGTSVSARGCGMPRDQCRNDVAITFENHRLVVSDLRRRAEIFPRPQGVLVDESESASQKRLRMQGVRGLRQCSLLAAKAASDRLNLLLVDGFRQWPTRALCRRN